VRTGCAALVVLACAACAGFESAPPGLTGKPLAEFFDDLKGELAAVHWRIRSTSAACGTAEPREVDLRNATIGLDLQRVGEAATAGGAVARSVNAALDGFTRSSAAEPCVRLTSLKLTFIVDVQRDAAGGFKLVVPAAQLGVDTSRRDINTLTLTWDKVVSNALR
jgi:hypothetical protein